GIPDQSIAEGGSFAAIALDNYVSDPDNPASEMTWSVSGNVELTVSIDPNRIATITVPSPEWNGSEALIFTASDPGGLSDADTAVFTVTAVNDPPVVAGIPDVSFAEDDTAQLLLNPYVTDVDDSLSALTFTAEVIGAAPFVAGVSLMPRRIDRKGFPTPGSSAKGADRKGSRKTSLPNVRGPGMKTVPIVERNRPSIFPRGASGGALPEVTVNDLQVTVDSVTHVATLAATTDSSGVFTVVFAVEDPAGAGDADTILVTVYPRNDPPRLVQAVPDTSIWEDSRDNVLVGSLSAIFTDPDGAGLTYQAYAPPELQVWIQGDSLLGTPQPDYFGEVPVLVVATDDSGSAAGDTFRVTVENVNDPPVPGRLVAPEDGDTLRELSGVVFRWQAGADVDGDRLSYTLRLFYPAGDTTVAAITDTMWEFSGALEPETRYSWTVLVADSLVSVSSPDTFHFVTPPAMGISREPELPRSYALYPNFPNPFNPETVIRYDLPRPGRVVLRIYNLLGQPVRTLVDGPQAAGRYRRRWDGRDDAGRRVASGVYVLYFQAGDFRKAGKLVLLR
ncbi:MAG: T9SS C-terminal target domain-containing protein, partial [Calditrichaeota bacterium]